MSELPASTAAIALPDVQEWLVDRVAFYLEKPRDAIDPDASLIEMGLDSVYAMTLSGDVEERFDLEMPATAAWDHSTVNKLAEFVCGELANR